LKRKANLAKNPCGIQPFVVLLSPMFGLSGGHLLILAIVVLLFGSRRLPELGSALGRGIGAFKKGLEGKSNDKDDPDQPNRLT
jgi:sec-independent protein translocase protein TatA